jgi:hypothetical protein
MISIRAVETPADLSAFIDLPYRLYRDVPNWVAPFKRDVRTQLDRKLNPFFEHGEAEYFLVERSGDVVGRVAAIVNRLHNEIHGDRVGFFGFFECVADAEAAEALLARAAAPTTIHSWSASGSSRSRICWPIAAATSRARCRRPSGCGAARDCSNGASV